MITLEGDDVGEMKEIKVRLWGTDIGVGISRCTAIVRSSFMPAKMPALPLLSVVSVSSRDKKKNDGRDENEDNEVPSKKGSSSSAASKRKRKAINLKQGGDSADNELPYELTTTPLYNSETGEGERPTVSSLSLRPFLFPHVPTSANSHSSHQLDGTSPLTEISSEYQLSVPAPYLAAAQTKKNGLAVADSINKFWKMIDDENYFQPFSRKTHRLDDLSLKGGDYNDLSDMTSHSPRQWATNEDEVTSPFVDLDVEGNANVPILMALRPPTLTCSLENPDSHNLRFENSHPWPLIEPFNLQSKVLTANKCTSDCSSFDFLYQRLVASFVFPVGLHENSSVDSSRQADGPVSSSSSSSSPSSPSSFGEIIFSDSTVESSEEYTKDPSFPHMNTKSEMGGNTELKHQCVESNNFIQNESDHTSNENHSISGSSNDSKLYSPSSHENSLNPKKSEYTKTENTQRSCTGDFNGILSDPKPVSKFSEFSNVRLSRSQRTLIELGEVGLLHAFDCRAMKMKRSTQYEVRSVEISPHTETLNQDTAPSSSHEKYTAERGETNCSSLSKQLEDGRTDDDVCFMIRYLVNELKEEEFVLNKGISLLRRNLDLPAVTSEGETRRKSAETKRLHLARWQKLRKKGKTVSKNPPRNSSR